MKRGTSGLSQIVGVYKEPGISSHDVVNRCRSIFSERRVGHAGTLDPSAQGVLLVCIGPATRLNPYLMAQDKKYRFKVCFGSATDTDDAQGLVIEQKPIPEILFDSDYAKTEVQALVGKHLQIPPAYSAIKVNGERAYAAARKGDAVRLEPREIEIFECSLRNIEAEGTRHLSWEIDARVSKGTYIRSIARDLGIKLGTCAHVTRLERTASGGVDMNQCARLSQLEQAPESFLIDPVPLLGYKTLEIKERFVTLIKNGAALEHNMFESMSENTKDQTKAATGILVGECDLEHDELFSIVAKNELLAIYGYDQVTHSLKPKCVFSTGVLRGSSY
ncbi:MAG: tRNA pseudouridine(55) synthase TruB [Raoultibacter sp.]|jgi:tRNA pseudouridine55 synthase